MAYVEGSLGAMLQGVSQQPARIRVAGQVTEQINYESDVSEGLTARPGTDELGALTGSTSTMTIQRVVVNDTDYILGHAAGELGMWTLDGTALTIVTPDGTGYLGPAMVFSNEEDGSLLCLNRATITLKSSTIVGRPFNAGLVTCLGGLFSRTYTVKVTYADSTEVKAVYSTPDGTTTGDSDKTSGAYIMYMLHRALSAHADLKAGTTLTLSDNTVIPLTIDDEPALDIEADTGEDFSLSIPSDFERLIRESLTTASTTLIEVTSGDTLNIEYSGPVSIVVDDGEYGVVLRSATDVVDDITSLPRFAGHGHVVRVLGDASEDDDYFLRFVSETTTVDGDGFGDAGVWRETVDPDIANSLDESTMPHALTVVGTTATFQEAAWQARRVGGEDSNPDPAFIGSAIRDIGGFEGRLVTVAGPDVDMSRTDEPRDFYKKSATVDTTSDPVSMHSRNAGGASLDWIIPFDRDLLIVSDPGEAQFVIKGGGITAGNASMVLTTDYTVDSDARPVTTGRTIMLPFVSGNFSGVNEFFTNDAVATNGADPLTSVQDRYITGRITGMAVAENFNRVVFQASGDGSTLWVYKYLWQGSERAQSAWYKQELPGEVRTVFFDSSNFYVVIDDPANAGTALLLRMDLNRADADVGFHITLDRKADKTVASNTVVADFPDALIVQRAGCETPGVPAQSISIVDNGDGTYTHTLDDEICPNTATVTVGEEVLRQLQPTEPLYRDRNNNVVSNAVLTVSAYLIHLAASSDVKATLTSPYRDAREYFPRRFPLDDEPLDPSRTGFMDYTLRVPWGERSTRADLTISSVDIRPDTILELEWLGDVRGNRRRI